VFHALILWIFFLFYLNWLLSISYLFHLIILHLFDICNMLQVISLFYYHWLNPLEFKDNILVLLVFLTLSMYSSFLIIFFVNSCIDLLLFDLILHYLLALLIVHLQYYSLFLLLSSSSMSLVLNPFPHTWQIWLLPAYSKSIRYGFFLVLFLSFISFSLFSVNFQSFLGVISYLFSSLLSSFNWDSSICWILFKMVSFW